MKWSKKPKFMFFIIFTGEKYVRQIVSYGKRCCELWKRTKWALSDLNSRIINSFGLLSPSVWGKICFQNLRFFKLCLNARLKAIIFLEIKICCRTNHNSLNFCPMVNKCVSILIAHMNFIMLDVTLLPWIPLQIAASVPWS